LLAGPAEIVDPRWLRRPSNLDRFYPRRAREAGIEGQAQLDCRVDLHGALDCEAISETPPGWGFGQAAVRIAEAYRMAPAQRDGRPVEGRYRMRVPFNVD
jgi:protein TonB